MIRRNLETSIRRYSSQYPVVAIVGPRQSGKTTPARHMFFDHRYLSMENLDIRHMAQDDPRGFLDEIQRVPAIFSYLLERVDLNQSPSSYILTVSQQFLLMEKITPSLAGRIIAFQLFLFSVSELYKRVYHTGEIPPFYFRRDKTGNEIDLVVDIGSKLLPVEIKASKTYSPKLKSHILSWLNLKNNTSEKGFVIYRGEDVIGKRSAVSVIPWWYL